LTRSELPESRAHFTIVSVRTRVGIRRSLLVFGGYLIGSAWLWRRFIPHLATRALGGGVLDPGMFVWWLKWVAFAVTRGMNPFHSTYLNSPSGVGAMWNASTVALGVLFTPVTLAFGAVASFNIACILGPPLAAWTAWCWLRRYVTNIPAIAGGALFGFSPFVIAHARAGHLNFMWLFLLPVIAMLVENLLWRSPRPLWPTAPLLGLAVAVQFLISSEALLILIVGCVVATLLIALAHPGTATRRLPIVVPAAAVAVVTTVALCALPLYEQFAGTQAIRKPVQGIGIYGGRLAMLVHPTHLLSFHSLRGPRGHLTSIEDGLYVGWPLLAVLALTLLFFGWRRRGVLIAAVVAVLAAALQMYGTRWQIGSWSLPAPLDLLQTHVRVTDDILPGRFGILMWLAIAWLFAVALDAILTRAPNWWRGAAAVLVGAACLVPLVPASEGPASALTATPPLFTTSLRTTIPQGSTVMIAPMAEVGDSAAEMWQVASDMRFRQLGGYMLHPVGANGTPSYDPGARALTELFGIQLKTDLPFGGPLTPALRRAALAELRASKASMFIVGDSPRRDEASQLFLAELLLGRPPDRRVGGVSIWELRPRSSATV
jgi:hypothetical protein